MQNSTDAQRTFRVRHLANRSVRRDNHQFCQFVHRGQEIMFLQELNAQHHDNIIRLLNVLKADNDKDIYLVFEYMGEHFGSFCSLSLSLATEPDVL
jgi:serine/threonine protein kinase